MRCAVHLVRVMKGAGVVPTLKVQDLAQHLKV